MEMNRHFRVVVLALLLVAGCDDDEKDDSAGDFNQSGPSTNYTPQPGSGCGWTTGSLSSSPEVRQSIISRINTLRAQNGLPPLSYQDGVICAAKRQVEDMSSNNYFGWQNPETGIDIPTRLVSSTPRIDFSDLRSFILDQSNSASDDLIWATLTNDETFMSTILDPKATHVGSYRSGPYALVIGDNVSPATSTGAATPTPTPAPTPTPSPSPSPSGGGSGGSGGGGGGRTTTTVRITRVRI